MTKKMGPNKQKKESKESTRNTDAVRQHLYPTVSITIAFEKEYEEGIL